MIGDSISAGYGSLGFSNNIFPCNADATNSGDYYTYNKMLAESF